MLNKSALTDMVVDALEPDGTEPEQWFVGDHEKPRQGGWQGEPMKSQFIPYVSITSLPSQSPVGPIGDQGDIVTFPYALTNMGDSRVMVERMSDIAREKSESLKRQKTSDGRTIGNVRVIRYGGVERLSREPPLFAITDQIMLWTST